MRIARLILVFVFCSISLVACSVSGQANSKIQSFWNWFQNNEQMVHASKDSSSPEFQEMATRLLSIDDRLGCEIGPAPDGRKELAISANLRPELVQLVQEIVKEAPRLKMWKVVAFRQPAPPDILKTMSMTASLADDKAQASAGTKRDITVAVKNMRFKIEQPAEVKIFLKGYTGSEQEQYIATTLLQQAIGEHKFLSELSGVSFERMTPANEKESLPFDELGVELDKVVARK